MTDDLVKDLRNSGWYLAKPAADRIEKLEAEEIEFDRVIGNYASENALFRDRIEKLEAALRSIVKINPIRGDVGSASIKEIVDAISRSSVIARKALEGKDD